ncbi:TetR/AcrR family transcriptional regulator [Crocosphaera sp.]|uniref:TetR/AcrR family transcriptional regulator n=1 Tax=Crocosphaera sp. TaxID=2729996 RepID=UPI0026063DE7|nr:TetR/AcrR family transcriptional regulator [Crocosphaera sp.]MDJ0583007.1 TetR/AcrR family transcriptional regulator [Crocosphaera sp.]
MNQIDTRGRIIEVCKDLIETKGYHSFSLSEVIKLSGTSHGNLYHHFKSKENLVKQTIIKYQEDFSEVLTKINQEESSLIGCLEGLINVYTQVLEPDNTKIYLCMALIVEINILPPSIIQELKKFFDLQVNWITNLFSQYEPETKVLDHEIEMLVSSLEGIIAVARMKGGSEYFHNLAHQLLDNFMIAQKDKQTGLPA